MKTLFRYLKPYKWLVGLVLLLAAINIGFSLIDPIIFGRLVDLGTYHLDKGHEPLSQNEFMFSKGIPYTNSKGESDKVYGEKLMKVDRKVKFSQIYLRK